MSRLPIVLLLPIALVACAHRGKPPLPQAAGEYRPLNAGRWSPVRDDLRGPRAPLAPAASPNIPAEPVQ